MSRYGWRILLAWVVVGCVTARADEAFFRLKLQDLKLVEGSLPQAASGESGQTILPRVIVDGKGEGYVPRYDVWANPATSEMAVTAPAGADVTGRLLLPNPDRSGAVSLKFKIPADQAKVEYRKDFFEFKAQHYEELVREGVPGGAWFRYQARRAREAIAQSPGQVAGPVPSGVPDQSLEETFDLFSGGRAVSENLQLDRALPAAQRNVSSVKVDSLEGITIQAIDWKQHLKPDAKVALDPLAAAIPADQHAVFFPSFAKLLEVADSVDQQQNRFQALAVPRSEDFLVKQRYERQLCLSTSALARLLGPALVRSVAVTGSDPYFPTGTDVAVLFDAPQPEALLTLISARVALGAQADPQAQPVEGAFSGVAYHGFRSPDRSVSSYVALVGKAVVVTNSTEQLARLVDVEQKKSSSIASLEEFRFFRTRYPLGEAEESALVFVSDATIRRWCGPRWRIASSRRTRDLGVMQELQAEFLDRLVAGRVVAGPVHTELDTIDGGDLLLSAGGISSSVLGTLQFQTPIIELPLESVTQQEAVSYKRWRDVYQQNWRWAFDPIAVRIHTGQQRLAADLTVMPLIVASEYNFLTEITRGAKLAPTAGDPHDAPLQWVMAFNRDAEEVRMGSNFLGGLVPGVSDPLSWMGSSVAVWVEDDPFWKELAAQPDERAREKFFEDHLDRLPVAAEISVANPLKLTAFLVGARAMVEQTSPGMINWQSLTYHDQPYVKLTPTERARKELPEGVKDPALCYAITPDGLLLTLSEKILRQTLDRQAERQKTKDAGQGAAPAAPAHGWLGESMGLQLDRSALAILNNLSRESYQHEMQRLAWSNLPILNEWKRRYPDHDPVALHEQFWQARLVCPGGGKYVWNNEWQTMESTVFGHPGQPKLPARDASPLAALAHVNFGLTFEQQGLRARVEVDEKQAEKSAGDAPK